MLLLDTIRSNDLLGMLPQLHWQMSSIELGREVTSHVLYQPLQCHKLNSYPDKAGNEQGLSEQVEELRERPCRSIHGEP